MKIALSLLTYCLLLLYACTNQSDIIGRSSSNAKNIENKLSNSIWVIYQSEDGRYWFGGEEGLYCYDNETIHHYTKKDGLCDNSIRSIQEDKYGNIYTCTINGISKFDGKNFTTLEIVKQNNWQLNPDDLWFNMLGKNGDLGPYRYDGTKLYQLEFPEHYMAADFNKNNPNVPWSPYEVYYIYKDSKGVIWFGTANLGICRYDGKSFSWLYEDHLTLTPQGGSFGIRSIIEDHNGTYWFCNTRYRYTISPDSIINGDSCLISYKRNTGIDAIQTPRGNDHIYIMSMVEDRDDKLWMVTYDEGVWCYDGKSVKHYEIKNEDENATLFSIYIDRDNTIWLGTHSNGIYKFNGQSFKRLEI